MVQEQEQKQEQRLPAGKRIPFLGSGVHTLIKINRTCNQSGTHAGPGRCPKDAGCHQALNTLTHIQSCAVFRE